MQQSVEVHLCAVVMVNGMNTLPLTSPTWNTIALLVRTYNSTFWRSFPTLVGRWVTRGERGKGGWSRRRESQWHLRHHKFLYVARGFDFQSVTLFVWVPGSYLSTHNRGKKCREGRHMEMKTRLRIIAIIALNFQQFNEKGEDVRVMLLSSGVRDSTNTPSPGDGVIHPRTL